MNLPEPNLVRETLWSLYGEERYCKFVDYINSRCDDRGRLLYWQEQLWAGVEEKLGIHIGDYRDIAALFRVCHVHGVELQRETLPIIYGYFKPLPQGYIKFEAAHFPLANDEARGPDWEEAAKEREVLFCTACRQAKEEWRARRRY